MPKVSSIGGAWRFGRGSCWALLGDDGAAKSRLCRIVAGEEPVPRGMSVEMDEGMEGRVRLVSFAQQRAAARKGGFLQARYYSLVDDAGPGDTVADVLCFNRVFDVNPFEVGRSRLAERRSYAAARRRIMPILRIRELMDRPFLALSNGETRRVLLAHALLSCPALLVLDDPCAGLDPERRDELKRLLDTLAAQGTALLLSVRHEDEIPSCVTEVRYLGRERGECRERGGLRERGGGRDRRDRRDREILKGHPATPVVELRGIRICFGRRKLFDGFSWTVRRGEHWVLQGPNGSGKTTLLALITGDSPLAYANDVTVFGVRRAPGTELAKVRRRIGMVSPEQQAYLGLGADELLEMALCKNPDLLLLDEPCLNLDAAASRRLRSRIARYLSSRLDCTAICVAHRPDDIPPGFGMSISLG